MNEILQEIANERIRQDAKWGEQNHSPIEWIAILTEEVGETSKEALEYHFKGFIEDDFDNESLQRYRKELIQTAAVAVSMLQCLDRKKWKTLQPNYKYE